MGTNFYWNPQIVQQVYNVDIVDTDDPRVHIGKRSAMGGYCLKCGITRAGHTRYVHCNTREDFGHVDSDAVRSHIKSDTCPNCGAPWATATSFTFTMMCHLVAISNLYNLEMAQRNRDPLIPAPQVVTDEYGEPYSAVKFLDEVLRVCPVQFQDYGRWS